MTLTTGTAWTGTAVSQIALYEMTRHVIHHAVVTPPIEIRGGAIRVTKHTASSSEHLPTTIFQRHFFQIPAPLRYFISGNCGNVIFYFTERLLYFALYHFHFARQPLPKEWTELMLPTWVNSVTFFSAYLLHVPAQHYLHALLVYGLESINTSAKYYKTLGGMFTTLTGSALGSTALNAFLLSTGKLNKTTAFILTLWSFSIVNYLIIGWIVRSSNKSSTVDEIIGTTSKIPSRGGGRVDKGTDFALRKDNRSTVPLQSWQMLSNSKLL